MRREVELEAVDLGIIRDEKGSYVSGRFVD